MGAPRQPTTDHLARHAASYAAIVDLDVTRAGDTSTITASGDLDLSSADKLSDAVRTTLAGDHGAQVALDLSGVRFIDSSGINALIEIRNATQQADVGLCLLKPSSRVVEVLRLTAVDTLFTIEDAR